MTVEIPTKGPDMITNVKARYSNGVLVPLEPLDLEEGEEILVSVEEKTHDSVEEDAALARAMDEAMAEDPDGFVSEEVIMATLRGVNGD